jgi:predicted HTH domain antitoxin
MESIILEIPSKVASQIKLPPNRAKEIIMRELVLRLYEERIITSGQGAVLLNMNRMEFERFLSENFIAFHSDPEELKKDISSLESAV